MEKNKRLLTEEEKDYIRAVVEESGPKFADTAVKRAFISAVEKRETDRKKIFRETEDLLRSKILLEENIEEYKQEIRRIEIGINEKHTSADIVAMASSRLSAEQLRESKIISLEAKIDRDQNQLNRIEKAIEKIKNDKWFKIIELKYFEDWEDEDIAEELEKDTRTIRRHKSRLVWTVSVKLRGGEMVG